MSDMDINKNQMTSFGVTKGTKIEDTDKIEKRQPKRATDTKQLGNKEKVMEFFQNVRMGKVPKKAANLLNSIQGKAATFQSKATAFKKLAKRSFAISPIKGKKTTYVAKSNFSLSVKEHFGRLKSDFVSKFSVSGEKSETISTAKTRRIGNLIKEIKRSGSASVTLIKKLGSELQEIGKRLTLRIQIIKLPRDLKKDAIKGLNLIEKLNLKDVEKNKYSEKYINMLKIIKESNAYKDKDLFINRYLNFAKSFPGVKMTLEILNDKVKNIVEGLDLQVTEKDELKEEYLAATADTLESNFNLYLENPYENSPPGLTSPEQDLYSSYVGIKLDTIKKEIPDFREKTIKNAILDNIDNLKESFVQHLINNKVFELKDIKDVLVEKYKKISKDKKNVDERIDKMKKLKKNLDFDDFSLINNLRESFRSKVKDYSKINNKFFQNFDSEKTKLDDMPEFDFNLETEESKIKKQYLDEKNLSFKEEIQKMEGQIGMIDNNIDNLFVTLENLAIEQEMGTPKLDPEGLAKQRNELIEAGFKEIEDEIKIIEKLVNSLDDVEVDSIDVKEKEKIEAEKNKAKVNFENLLIKRTKARKEIK